MTFRIGKAELSCLLLLVGIIGGLRTDSVPSDKTVLGSHKLLRQEDDCVDQGAISCEGDEGQCYLAEQRCNFIPECDNYRDEASCSYYCDFEFTLCHWIETDEGSIAWKTGVKDGDHTIGGSIYLGIGNDNQTDLGGRSASLRSTVFHASGPNCTLKFWYRMQHDSDKLAPSIKAGVITPSGTQTIFETDPNGTALQWGEAVGLVGAHGEMEMFIEASLGSGLSYVHLDDIDLVDCQGEGR